MNCAELQIWQDLNHDGITRSGELASLADRGISLENAVANDNCEVRRVA